MYALSTCRVARSFTSFFGVRGNPEAAWLSIMASSSPPNTQKREKRRVWNIRIWGPVFVYLSSSIAGSSCVLGVHTLTCYAVSGLHARRLYSRQ